MADAEHVITVEKYPYVGDMDFVYFAVCSCGKYSSGKHFSPGKAEGAGSDHVKSKTKGRS